MRDRAISVLGSDATNEMMKRALSGEPLAYIKGFTNFAGMEFKVTPDVMIPRAASEVLVNSSFDHIKASTSCAEDVQLSSIKVLDLGTGIQKNIRK